LSKDKDNILQFPDLKNKKNKISSEDIDRLTEEVNYQKQEVEMIEHTIDEIAIAVIRQLVDIGVDINKKHFYGDLALLTEIARGMIFRDFGREHLAQALIDKIVTVQNNEKGEVAPTINYGKVLDSKDLPGQKLDFGQPEEETEIHFEPDFELPIPPEDDDK
tara:strand:+ start:101 stop:586 length:486 start_codon:yes stop_codon:yes gene_type:complete